MGCGRWLLAWLPAGKESDSRSQARAQPNIAKLRRSLRNALERAVAFSDGRPILPRDCTRHEDSDGPPEALKGLADSLEAAQVKLLKALRPCIPPHKVRRVEPPLGRQKVSNGRRPPSHGCQQRKTSAS